MASAAPSTGESLRDRPVRIVPLHGGIAGGNASDSLRPRAPRRRRALSGRAEPPGRGGWQWATARWCKEEHGADCLDLVVSLSAPRLLAPRQPCSEAIETGTSHDFVYGGLERALRLRVILPQLRN